MDIAIQNMMLGSRSDDRCDLPPVLTPHLRGFPGEFVLRRTETHSFFRKTDVQLFLHAPVLLTMKFWGCLGLPRQISMSLVCDETWHRSQDVQDHSSLRSGRVCESGITPVYDQCSLRITQPTCVWSLCSSRNCHRPNRAQKTPHCLSVPVAT